MNLYLMIWRTNVDQELSDGPCVCEISQWLVGLVREDLEKCCSFRNIEVQLNMYMLQGSVTQI